MRYTASITLLLFITATLSAQKHQVKIGGGIGNAPYEGTPSLNIDAQYEYLPLQKVAPFLALGVTRNNFSLQGRSRGSSGGITWDNTYESELSEQMFYADLGLKFRLSRSANRYRLKAAIGGSLISSRFNYVQDLSINRGAIEAGTPTTSSTELGMFLVGIENYYFLSEQLSLSLNLYARTCFREKAAVTRYATFDVGAGSSTSSISSAVNLNFQVGYRF